MGMRPNAYLFYGIEFEEGCMPWEEESQYPDDWWEEFCKKGGFFGAGYRPFEWVQLACEDGNYALYVPGTMISADWDDTKKVSIAKLTEVNHDDIETFCQNIRQIGVKGVIRDPQWMLAAYYG